MERETRFELATLALARRCSTTELLPLVAVLSIPGPRNAVKPRTRSRMEVQEDVPASDKLNSGRVPFSSRTISPSRMVSIRPAIVAASGL
jgi:hypothetical protein